jgi:hypothetical protein
MEQSNSKWLVLFVIICIVLFSILFFLSHATYKPGVDMSFYDSKYTCTLILDQRVSCYKGCQFYFKINNVTQQQYDGCLTNCQQEYGLEYNAKGHITSCWYENYSRKHTEV